MPSAQASRAASWPAAPGPGISGCASAGAEARTTRTGRTKAERMAEMVPEPARRAPPARVESRAMSKPLLDAIDRLAGTVQRLHVTLKLGDERHVRLDGYTYSGR